MLKAYLILAHRSPKQLYRLIEALDDGCSVFYIHIDRRSNISEFDNLQDFKDKLYWLPRFKTSWAGLGLVKAAIEGLKKIRSSGYEFSKVFLMSGQDYPVKSNAFIQRLVEQDPDTIFLEHFSLPAYHKWHPQGGLYRVNKYFFGFGLAWRLLGKSLNLLSKWFPFVRRKMYKGLKPYAGSMWWGLSSKSVEYILAFIENNPGYLKFHRYTFAPDEVFFHTIIMNAGENDIKQKVENNDKRYIKWNDISSAHPEILTTENIGHALQSDAFFARKFDEQIDPAVFDQIDIHRNNQA